MKLHTVGALKTEAAHLCLEGMLAAMKFELIMLSRASGVNSDVVNAYPFFETAMRKLREPPVAAPEEAPAVPEEALAETLGSWLKGMITSEHGEMAAGTTRPRLAIRRAIEKALEEMYDRTLCVALLWRPWTASPLSPGVYGAVVSRVRRGVSEILDLTMGSFEQWDDIQGVLAILEKGPAVFLERNGIFPDDASDGLKGAVYHVISSVLPNCWRERYREVLVPPLLLPRVSHDIAH